MIFVCARWVTWYHFMRRFSVNTFAQNTFSPHNWHNTSWMMLMMMMLGSSLMKLPWDLHLKNNQKVWIRFWVRLLPAQTKYALLGITTASTHTGSGSGRLYRIALKVLCVEFLGANMKRVLCVSNLADTRTIKGFTRSSLNANGKALPFAMKEPTPTHHICIFQCHCVVVICSIHSLDAIPISLANARVHGDSDGNDDDDGDCTLAKHY